MRVEEENIHAIELDAVHLGFGGEVKHRVEVNARLGARTAFADQSGPHGVVQFRVVVGMVAHGSSFRSEALGLNLVDAVARVQTEFRFIAVSRWKSGLKLASAFARNQCQSGSAAILAILAIFAALRN